MSETMTKIEIEGSVWVGDAADPMDGEVQLDGVCCAVVTERTDVDEVAVHATVPGDDNAVVSIYLSRVAALALSKLLELDARVTSFPASHPEMRNR